MVRIRFIHPDGVAQDVDAEIGMSVMRVAKQNSIKEIVAECGGACMCATCHVRLDADALEKSGERTLVEEEMLPFAIDSGPNSRLSCQMTVTPDYEGIEIHLPERQL
jgi:2Fe-2S ferredoxin